jgi:hypothetical protein
MNVTLVERKQCDPLEQSNYQEIADYVLDFNGNPGYVVMREAHEKGTYKEDLTRNTIVLQYCDLRVTKTIVSEEGVVISVLDSGNSPYEMFEWMLSLPYENMEIGIPVELEVDTFIEALEQRKTALEMS